MSSVVISGNTSGSITLSAPDVSGSNTLSLPAVTDTLAGIAATQTLTNKTLVAPALGTPASGVLTNCTGVPASALPAGSVLQVVSTTKTSRFSVSSATFVDITGLSAAITPVSTNSKILVIVSLGAIGTNSAPLYGFKILRGSTAIGLGDASGSTTLINFSSAVPADLNAATSTAYSIYDSPATTSSTTYKVQTCSLNGAVAIVINGSSNTAQVYNCSSSSTITLMEIAG